MQELMLIQSKLKAPKGQYNSFGKYKYRSAEDILEAVKPLLAEHNCILTLKDDLVELGGRFYIRATAKLTNKELKSIETYAFAREDESKKGMDGSQITGTASSYARKYALNGLFLIDDTKDADTDEYKKQTTRQPKKTAEELSQMKPDDKVTPGGADFVRNLCKEVGSEERAVCDYFHVNNFEEMTVSEMKKACAMLEKKKK